MRTVEQVTVCGEEVVEGHTLSSTHMATREHCSANSANTTSARKFDTHGWKAEDWGLWAARRQRESYLLLRRIRIVADNMITARDEICTADTG